MAAIARTDFIDTELELLRLQAEYDTNLMFDSSSVFAGILLEDEAYLSGPIQCQSSSSSVSFNQSVPNARFEQYVRDGYGYMQTSPW